jgi:hypothetical protein
MGTLVARGKRIDAGVAEFLQIRAPLREEFVKRHERGSAGRGQSFVDPLPEGVGIERFIDVVG